MSFQRRQDAIRGERAMRRARRRGAGVVLLEVVMALALLASTVTVVSAAMSRCQQSVERMRIRQVLTDLAVSRMSELHAGLLAVEQADGADFDDPLWADYAWSLSFESINSRLDVAENTHLVIVTVRHRATGMTRRLAEFLDTPMLSMQ